MGIVQEVSPRGDPRVIALGLGMLLVFSILHLILQFTGKIGTEGYLLFYTLYVVGFLVALYGYRKTTPKRYFFEEE